MSFKTIGEWDKTNVNYTDGNTTICAGPCLLRKIMINTTHSANDCTIMDGSQVAFILPASIAAGSDPDYGDVRFTTSLIANAGSLGAGNFTVIWKPDHEGLAGDGYQ